MTPVAASKDSAWVRAQHARAAEVFTLDVQDSIGGRRTGTQERIQVVIAPAPK